MAFNQQQFETAFLNLPSHDQQIELPLHIFETIPSTNQKLWELLDQGATPPIVAIASEQTAGRGQWGRKWQSKLGGLYLSLALAPQISGANAAHLTLCSAWGIASALRHHNIPVLLKWPNDLILGRRKLGGIKSETRLQQGQIVQAVVGVGINWANPVPDIGINLRSFLESQPFPAITSLEMLAATTVHGLLSGYQRYLSEGIDTLLSSYLELLDSLGRTIVVDGCSGVVVGVTPNGKLRVRFHSVGAATEISLHPGAISLGYDW